MLDLVSNGRVDFGTGESSSEAELGGFMIDPTKKREMWEEGLRVAVAVHDRDAVHRPLGQVRDDAAAQRRARSRCRSRTRRCGSRAAAATRSTSPRRRASARSRSRSSIPKRRSTGSTTTTRRSSAKGVPIGDAVNANVACVTTFMCHDDEDEALAAGSRAPTSSATRSRTTTCSAGTSPGVTDVWDEYQQRRAEQGYDPEAVAAAAERGPARRQGRRARASAGCAARSARPTRSASTSGATRSAASTR